MPVMTIARFPFPTLSLSLALLAAGPAAALDWPQFRGVNRDGVSAETDLPRSWPAKGPQVVWKRAIGEGYSGISVVGDRLYTMDSDGTAEYVLALEAGSGKEVWRVPAGPKLIDNMGNGPRTTPTLDGGTVYAMGSHGRLLALKAADGAKIWEVDLPQALGAKRPTWGYSGSPLIDGDLLILEVGGKEGRGVVAFEKATGKVRWGALDGDAAYSSPVLMTIGGIKQYVVTRRAGSQTVALRSDGTVLWTHPGPFTVIASALFIPPDKVYVSGGDDAGAVLLRIKTEGGKAVEELWKTRTMKNHFNNAVLVGSHLYGFDNATFKCLSVATGEQTWAFRGLGKGSLLAADGNLLIVLADQGTLLLVEATPDAYTDSHDSRPWRARRGPHRPSPTAGSTCGTRTRSLPWRSGCQAPGQLLRLPGLERGERGLPPPRKEVQPARAPPLQPPPSPSRRSWPATKRPGVAGNAGGLCGPSRWRARSPASARKPRSPFAASVRTSTGSTPGCNGRR